MTVEELIEKLKEMPQDARVLSWDGESLTYKETLRIVQEKYKDSDWVLLG